MNVTDRSTKAGITQSSNEKPTGFTRKSKETTSAEWHTQREDFYKSFSKDVRDAINMSFKGLKNTEIVNQLDDTEKAQVELAKKYKEIFEYFKKMESESKITKNLEKERDVELEKLKRDYQIDEQSRKGMQEFYNGFSENVQEIITMQNQGIKTTEMMKKLSDTEKSQVELATKFKNINDYYAKLEKEGKLTESAQKEKELELQEIFDEYRKEQQKGMYEFFEGMHKVTEKNKDSLMGAILGPLTLITSPFEEFFGSDGLGAMGGLFKKVLFGKSKKNPNASDVAKIGVAGAGYLYIANILLDKFGRDENGLDKEGGLLNMLPKSMINALAPLIQSFTGGGGMMGMLKNMLPKGIGAKVGASGFGKLATNIIGKGGIIGGLVMMLTDGIKATIQDKFGASKISTFIGGMFGSMDGGIKGIFQGMGKWALLGAGIGTVVPVVGTLIGGLVGALIGGILGFIGGKKIAKFFDGIGNFFKKGFVAIGNFFVNVGSKLKEKTLELGSNIKTFYQNTVEKTKEHINTVKEKTIKLGSQMKENLTTFVKNSSLKTGNFFKETMSKFMDTKFGKAVSETMDKALNFLTQEKFAWDKESGIVDNVKNLLGVLFGNLKEKISNFLENSSIGNIINNVLVKPIKNALSFVGIDNLFGDIKESFDRIKNFFSFIKENGIKGLGTMIVDFFKNLPKTLKNMVMKKIKFVKTLGTFFKESFKNVVNGIKSSGGIKNILKSFTEFFKESFKNVVNGIKSSGGIKNILKSFTEFFKESFKNVVNGIKSSGGIKNILKSFTEFFKNAFDNIITFITGGKFSWNEDGGILSNMKMLTESIFTNMKDKISDFFESNPIGKFIKNAIISPMQNALSIIGDFFGYIGSAWDWKHPIESISNLFGGFKVDEKTGTSKFQEYHQIKMAEREVSIDDGIIRPDGSVIHTNPKDTLIALKNIPESSTNLRLQNQSDLKESLSSVGDISSINRKLDTLISLLNRVADKEVNITLPSMSRQDLDNIMNGMVV